MFRKIAKNIATSWIGLGVSLAIAFFMSPFLVHSLGDTQYGIWVLVLSLTGYMGLLDAGLKVAVVKHVARQSATGDIDGVSRTVSTVLVIYGGLAVVLMTVASVVGVVLGDLFEVPVELQASARVLLLIASATLAVTLLGSVFNGFIAGVQRYDISNGVGIVTSLLAAGAIYAVVSHGKGIVGVGVVHLLSHALAGVLLWRASIGLRRDLHIGLGNARLRVAKDLYSYSAFVLLNNVAMLFLFRSGELLAGAFLGAAAVTYYAIGGSLVEYLGKLVGTMTQVLHPYASAQHARGDHEGIGRGIILGTRACIAIALPACVTFVLVGKPFIAAWMGQDYAETSGPILILLSIARLFWLAQSAAGNILLGAGRHKQLTTFTATTGVLGMIMAVALVGRFGLAGIAAGMAISIVVNQGIAMPIFICRTIGISWQEYVLGAVAGPVVATLPFAGVLFALVWALPTNTIGMIGLAVGLAAPVFALVGYFTCLGEEDRARLREAARGALLRSKHRR